MIIKWKCFYHWVTSMMIFTNLTYQWLQYPQGIKLKVFYQMTENESSSVAKDYLRLQDRPGLVYLLSFLFSPYWNKTHLDFCLMLFFLELSKHSFSFDNRWKGDQEIREKNECWPWKWLRWRSRTLSVWPKSNIIWYSHSQY